MIKVGLAQVNFCVGDIKENTLKVISTIEKARKKKVDLLVFPELSLVGYPPQDLLLKKHFVQENRKALDKIKKYTKNIVILLGFVDSDSSGSIYNACALIQDGKILDIYRKTKLPNYGVFDEKRYFQPGTEISSYSFKGHKFSVTICADIWGKGFVDLLRGKDFDFVINISASPFHMGKLSMRKDILKSVSKSINCPILYCNLVGGQDDLVFDGASMVVDVDGKIVNLAKEFKEDLLITKFPLKNTKSFSLEADHTQEAFDALCLGVKDYIYKHSFNKVVVGVSGGIDSAAVLALSVLALGKKNVYGLLMPSRFTSRETFSDAKKLCKNLGVEYSVISIDEIFDSYLKNTKKFFNKKPLDKTEENIQARIRGNLLMAFSNKFGYLVFNTGNKSELSCGYCTLYGDMVGGFGILSDIPKTLVYSLSHYINKYCKKNVIPLSIIKRPPSAELKFNQKDSDSLPDYDILDPILKFYVEDDLSLDQIVAKGIDKKIAKKIIDMVDRNEYKRRQAPMGIKITPRAFGRDRRMPITNKFSY